MKYIFLFVSFFVVLLFSSSLVLAEPITDPECCERVLLLYDWKNVTFPSSFPFDDAMVLFSCEQVPAGFVKLEENNITAIGCAIPFTYQYQIDILSLNLLDTALQSPTTYRTFSEQLRSGNLHLTGTDTYSVMHAFWLRTKLKYFWRFLG
jgi:hypothetical protein